MTDDLRRALAALSPRERRALHHHCGTAAERWSPLLPRLGAVWSALADVVAEISANENARAAADPGRPTVRHARRQRI